VLFLLLSSLNESLIHPLIKADLPNLFRPKNKSANRSFRLSDRQVSITKKLSQAIFSPSEESKIQRLFKTFFSMKLKH
jgi:hypothetical protein